MPAPDTSAVRAVLLDIEGTTSSIRFVYDEMFPLARRELDGYLRRHWGEPALAAACDQIARDAGHDNLSAWRSASGVDEQDAAGGRRLVADEVRRLMDKDLKATGLKQLQGMIWKSGFESGELRSHVYDEVAPALRRWRRRGVDLRIYSSGSVAAQRLFFGHTVEGDLLSLFSGHYDTTTGGKRQPASYTAIADDWGRPPAETLFISDVTAELDAAREAGFVTRLCVRPGNAEAPRGHGHAAISSFDELTLGDEAIEGWHP